MEGRRTFLAGVFALIAARLWAAQQGGIPDASSPGQTMPQEQRIPPPPDMSDDRQPPLPPDPHAVLKQNQIDIKKDMTQLESLVADLRKQVDTIDSSNVLSMELIHKAEEIEKLAHQIKTLARGL